MWAGILDRLQFVGIKIANLTIRVVSKSLNLMEMLVGPVGFEPTTNGL